MSAASTFVRTPRSSSTPPPARHHNYFPVGRQGAGGKGEGAVPWPASADACLGWAWGVCLLVLIIAWIVLTIIYVVKVASHQSQMKLASTAAIPSSANFVQTTVPVQIFVRQPAGLVQRMFVASNGMGKVGATAVVSDYAAAVRLVPAKQRMEGMLSDGDEVRLLFIRDGVWLTAAGDLSPDPSKAATVAVTGAGKGELIRAPATVRLGTPGATAGGNDPIAAVLQPMGAGSSILPFLNGSGC